MLRAVLVAAAAAFTFAFSSSSYSQTVTVQQVQLLAPQLAAFAGSSANLAALVSGLAHGVPVTLVTPAADGQLQIATFNPPAAGSAVEVARALEAARSSLISRGIAAPTAQQIGVALMGGGLPTPLGVVQVPGVLTGTAGASAVLVRSSGSTAQIFNAPGAPITDVELQGRAGNTSDSRFFGTSNSPSFGTSNTPPTASGAIPTPRPDTGMPRGSTAEGANRAIRRGG